ncbi:MAG: hypothetical protein KAS94_07785 [Desulfobulbaceae bacterium]|nr:hypothetical protein [Desulfobulbaceae bacterium]
MSNDNNKTGPRIASNYKIYGAMALGLSTAIGFRALIVIDRIQPEWVRPVWYFAVLGNFLFFWHRYLITQKRKRAIQNHRLIEKIKAEKVLSAEERHDLTYLLESIKRSPENINYLIISLFSLVAIGTDQIIQHFFTG